MSATFWRVQGDLCKLLKSLNSFYMKSVSIPLQIIFLLAACARIGGKIQAPNLLLEETVSCRHQVDVLHIILAF